MAVNGANEKEGYIVLSTFLTAEEVCKLAVLSQADRITLAGMIRNAVLEYIKDK